MHNRYQVTIEGKTELVGEFARLHQERLAKLYPEQIMDRQPGKIKIQMVKGKNPQEEDTRVAGVPYENRQELVAKMTTETPLRLVREPDNIYDENAIAVHALIEEQWCQIGYLHRWQASRLAPLLDRGEQVDVEIRSIEKEFVEDWQGDVLHEWMGVKIKLSYQWEISLYDVLKNESESESQAG
jgi:hypothetical protein